ASPATRKKALTGVCKSASTVRTTGTTLPRVVSRSNSSNDAGDNLSIRGKRSDYLLRAQLFRTQQPACRQPLPTVNDDDRAVNKRSGIGAEEQRGVFDVADTAEATDGDAVAQFVFERGCEQTLHALRVFDGTGRNGVRAYLIAAPFNCERARQRINTRFRGRRVRLHLRAEILQRHTDVQNRAAAFFQFVKRGPTDVERAFEINIYDCAEAVGR